MLTKNDTIALQAGAKVFCTVQGDWYGWQEFVRVRPRDGYIKIRGFAQYCPPWNFQLTAPRRQTDT